MPVTGANVENGHLHSCRTAGRPITADVMLLYYILGYTRSTITPLVPDP
jgi:hypothetical protein